MVTCVGIYCSLHLESFFIVVTLTQTNILGPIAGRYRIPEPCLQIQNPVVSNMQTQMKDGTEHMDIYRPQLSLKPDSTASSGLRDEYGFINILTLPVLSPMANTPYDNNTY